MSDFAAADSPVLIPKQHLVWDLIKPAGTFAFNFNKALYLNNKILGLTIRERLYSEPVS
jgi:hypothetical protein